MDFADIIAKRRSVYLIDKNLPISDREVEELVRHLLELVPDAFNQRSQRIVLAFGKRHDELWDAIYDAFGGKVAREKIDSFKAGAGTVLFFTDLDAVKKTQELHPNYADRFGPWSQHAMGMLQFAVWTGLAERGIGASLQHYNPVIDDKVKELYGITENWQLIAQMPFGGIVADPAPKQPEDINARFRIAR